VTHYLVQVFSLANLSPQDAIWGAEMPNDMEQDFRDPPANFNVCAQFNQMRNL